MRNIDKKILSYYLYFRTIKDHDKKVVARVKGNTILSMMKNSWKMFLVVSTAYKWMRV